MMGLKPCPFCGNELVRSSLSTSMQTIMIHPTDSGGCFLSGIRLFIDEHDEDNERVRKWNRRSG